MQQLFLKKHEDRRLRAGHLWIFSNEVDVKRSPLTAFAPGEAAQVCAADGRTIGTAYVNPASLIAARIVSRKADEPLDAALIKKRLERALQLRETLFDVPFTACATAKATGCPASCSTATATCSALRSPRRVWKPRRMPCLKCSESCSPQSRAARNDVGVRTMENLPLLVETGMGTVPDEIEVRESGAAFTVSLAEGQKTGWFYDQRPNRVEAAKYAKGKTVLDAFCYAGAFGVMAARNGAAGVTFLDASRQALDMASRNLAANAGCPGETLPGDALDTLASLRDGGRKFGVVCVDPPAFIKRKKDAEQGLNAYRRVNDLGLQLVENGGILTSCSCSHHLEAEALRRLIAQCAAKRGLNTQLLYQGFQGPDHPVHPSMPETAYLKVFILRVWKD
ncbi:MAG: class I SAM-dependent rRNA methyltransferase [Bilophila wadsworthia]